jgi:hypothetical protein
VLLSASQPRGGRLASDSVYSGEYLSQIPAVEIYLNVGYCNIFKNIIYNIVTLIRSDHQTLIGRLRRGQIHNTVATMTKFRVSHPIHDRIRFESGPIDHYNTELVLSYTALFQSFSFNYSGRR